MVVTSIKSDLDTSDVSDLDTSDVCEYFFVVDRNQPVKFCKQFKKMSTNRLKAAKAVESRSQTDSKEDFTTFWTLSNGRLTCRRCCNID